MGKGLKNFVINRGQGSRIGTFNRVNNIIEPIRGTRVNPVITTIITTIITAIHSRGLLIVDPSFETRFLPLLRHLMDI